MRFSYKDVFYPDVAVVPDQAAASVSLKPGILVLVMPGDVPKSLKFLCPCGCGEIISVNLMRQAGKAWRIRYDKMKGFSLFPSVWLNVGCKSHFILRDNTARLLYGKPPRVEYRESDEAEWWE